MHDTPSIHRPMLAALLATGLLSAGWGLPVQAAMDQATFEQRLSELQALVDEAVAHHQAGEAEATLEDARAVRQAFTFQDEGASELEATIKALSATAIGDRIKALASKLVSAIETDASAEEVARIGEDLAPSLNRLVLVAQGKATPASNRELRTPEAIQAAADEVLAQVDQAVDLHLAGDQQAAKAAAEEAFFTYETNGLGPDTSTVDDDLENEVENMIVNFDERTAGTNPGLSQLIAQGANATAVQAQADEIRTGIAQVVELLQATLPPLDLGDANQDGRVSIVDALLTAQASLGIRASTPAMDANQDGRVSIVDALLIAQASLGIREL